MQIQGLSQHPVEEGQAVFPQWVAPDFIATKQVKNSPIFNFDYFAWEVSPGLCPRHPAL